MGTTTKGYPTVLKEAFDEAHSDRRRQRTCRCGFRVRCGQPGPSRTNLPEVRQSLYSPFQQLCPEWSAAQGQHDATRTAYTATVTHARPPAARAAGHKIRLTAQR